MKKNKLLQQILEHYKMVNAIPPLVQKNTLLIRKRVLKTTLKSAGELSVYYSLVLKIYWLVRKFGRKLTIQQSKIVLGLIVTILLLITFFIIYFVPYYKYNSHKKVIKIEDHKYKGIVLPDKKKKSLKKIEPELLKVQLCIERFKALNISKKEAESITLELYRLLKKHKNVTMRAENKNKISFIAQLLLVGSVWKIGEDYSVSVKIVNAESGLVYWGTIKKYTNTGDDSIRDLSKDIIDQINEL